MPESFDPNTRTQLTPPRADTEPLVETKLSATGSWEEATRTSGGTPHQPPQISEIPPELLDNAEYEVVRELGRGGMGVVYLAKNKLMGRDEVLKVMGRALMDRPGAAARFLREIQSAARLNHQNIVRAYSARQLGDLLVLAMEYVPGDELGKFVKDRGRLPVLNACVYVQQVAFGLQHAHENEMVHRDIKPANLILHRNGKRHVVKILDFGLAKVTSETGPNAELTGSGASMGTPHYMPPEQAIDAARADIRADIYSLGCTLFFLLTGEPPFSGDGPAMVLYKHRYETARPVNSIRPDVSAALAGIVAKMIAKEPSARYQTPIEVANALMPFIRPPAPPITVVRPPPVPKPVPKPKPPLPSPEAEIVVPEILDSIMPVARPAGPTADERELFEAATIGDRDRIRELVDRGVNLDARVDQGASVLFYACLMADVKLVRLLLELGADPNLVAVGEAVAVYAPKPLDLVMQAQYLKDWSEYKPLLELLLKYGASDWQGQVPTAADLRANRNRARDRKLGNAPSDDRPSWWRFWK